MHEHPNDYIKPELMACCGAREIRDGDLVIVGTGFPTVAANIAKYTHAPGATMMQESGVYDARPARPALSVGDPCLNPGAGMVGGLADVMGMFLQGGQVNVGFLAGSQVDKDCIGHSREVRFCNEHSCQGKKGSYESVTTNMLQTKNRCRYKRKLKKFRNY